MKADLREANLHLANLQDVNLLGAKLRDAKLEGVRWGNMVLQESQALSTADTEQRLQLFSEAEEIYKCIGREMRNQGMVGETGWFFLSRNGCAPKTIPEVLLSPRAFKIH